MPRPMPPTELLEAVVTASSPGPRLRGRVLGRRIDAAAGPWVVCIAGMHGNEPAGVEAVDRVFRTLEASGEKLSGGLVGLAGNLAALSAGRRFIDDDLNRLWSEEHLSRVRSGSAPLSVEERELAELNAELSATLAAAHGRVHLLDLHTTSGEGPAFTVLDDALPNRRFALELSVPLVLGLEEELAGTMAFHWTARGVVCVAFEAGRHDDPDAVERSEAAIWIALDTAGVLPAKLGAHADAGRMLLEADRGEVPRLVEIVHRHRIDPEDRFVMRPGFAGFDEVERGQVLGDDRRGEVVAGRGGRILMPLYQDQGDDAFFLTVRVPRIWFELSARLRRAGVDRLLPYLPGIRRHRGIRDEIVVNRLIARWAVRRVFHLLGYRRIRENGWRVVFARRRDRA
jgi:succinylglutamate desuccinylase